MVVLDNINKKFHNDPYLLQKLNGRIENLNIVYTGDIQKTLNGDYGLFVNVNNGESEIFVVKNRNVIGKVILADVLRENSKKTIAAIRDQGISNISSDLIIGYPTQTLKDVQESVKHLLDLKIIVIK